MRLAFIDPVFTWPPAGGAPQDLFHTITGLQRYGHEAALFYGRNPGNPFESAVEATTLPFNSIPITTDLLQAPPTQIAAQYRQAVDIYRPDVVFQCFGFFLKPYLSQALAHYPQIGRYYAYEPFCPRDFRLFKNGATCPKNFLFTPNACRWCTLRSMWRDLGSGYPNPYTLEYYQTRAFTPGYHALLRKSITQYSAIAVNNDFTRQLLGDLNPNVTVVGGGVNLADFPYRRLASKTKEEKKIVLMTGRADDPTKGLDVLLEAGQELARQRNDFEVWITDHHEATASLPWLHCLGWQPASKMGALYAQADIAVFPSRWEEPFGLVALEAMATGRPVVTADTGGLRDIVIHEETGLHYPRHDAEALATALARLLDSDSMRQEMGTAGRRRVETHYDWKQVIAQRYVPLIEAAYREGQS